VTTSWVAGTVRAKAIARRRVGASGARSIAVSEDLEAALSALGGTSYDHAVHGGQGLAEAQHAVAGQFLWHLRVLAGWLPRDGAQAIRLVAGGFEIANVDEHLRRLAGLSAEPPFDLGTLETAWTRIAATSSLAELQRVLAASAWGDPGAATPRDIHLGMRLAWAERVVGGVPAAAAWARAALALLVVRECLLTGRPLTGRQAERARNVLGPSFIDLLDRPVPPQGELAARLPGDTRWALQHVELEQDLWTADARWWRRVEEDGFRGLRGASFGPAPVLGAVAVLAADARRVRAALATAARAAGTAGVLSRHELMETYDALA
jgi:hypothetical protein